MKSAACIIFGFHLFQIGQSVATECGNTWCPCEYQELEETDYPDATEIACRADPQAERNVDKIAAECTNRSDCKGFSVSNGKLTYTRPHLSWNGPGPMCTMKNLGKKDYHFDRTFCKKRTDGWGVETAVIRKINANSAMLSWSWDSIGTYAASKCIDGKFDGSPDNSNIGFFVSRGSTKNSCQTAGSSNDAWLQLDMGVGVEVEVDRVEITNWVGTTSRLLGCGNKYSDGCKYGFEVRVGNTKCTEFYKCRSDPVCYASGQFDSEGIREVQAKCSKAVSGRYVTIYLPGRDRKIGLQEVEVYGVAKRDPTPKPTPPPTPNPTFKPTTPMPTPTPKPTIPAVCQEESTRYKTERKYSGECSALPVHWYQSCPSSSCSNCGSWTIDHNGWRRCGWMKLGGEMRCSRRVLKSECVPYVYQSGGKYHTSDGEQIPPPRRRLEGAGREDKELVADRLMKAIGQEREEVEA